MASDTRFVRGAEKLSRRISTIRSKLQLPALMDEIGELLLKRTKDRFKAEVTPEGRPWVPLSPYTLRRKAALGYGDAQKLVRTGKLRDSIERIRGRADGGTFFNTGAGFRIGITDPEIAEYAKVQNQGSHDGRIPARRFLGISALDVKAVDSFLRRKGAAAMESSL